MEAIILTIITAATPLMLAAMGELVVERSGVLNLGVEGMMVGGAVCGFGAAYVSGSAAVGVLAGIGGGMAISLLFAIMTQTFLSNQVATGLALTLLGLGVSGLIGESFVGLPGVKLGQIYIPLLTDLPVIGRIFFGQDILVYASIGLMLATSYVLFKDRKSVV